MTSSMSLLYMRAMTSLSAGLPGTIARTPLYQQWLIQIHPSVNLLPRVGIRSMTLEAVLRKDGTNVLIKGKFCRPSENSRYNAKAHATIVLEIVKILMLAL